MQVIYYEDTINGATQSVVVPESPKAYASGGMFYLDHGVTENLLFACPIDRLVVVRPLGRESTNAYLTGA
jgi:hypothetical protein